MDDKKPWIWGEGDRLTLVLKGAPPLNLSLVPCDPSRVLAFEERLQLAHSVTLTLRDAHRAYRTGRTGYVNAARRLNRLMTEWDKASREEFAVAVEVFRFFREQVDPSQFSTRDLNCIVEIAKESVDRLMAAAVPKPPPAPPTSEPKKETGQE